MLLGIFPVSPFLTIQPRWRVTYEYPISSVLIEHRTMRLHWARREERARNRDHKRKSHLHIGGGGEYWHWTPSRSVDTFIDVYREMLASALTEKAVA